MILRLRYIQRFTDRHGKARLYLRRKGCKAIPLPPRDSPNFLTAYQAALAASIPEPKVSRVPARSLEALARSYYKSTAFGDLAETTQAVWRRIIDGLCRKHGEKPVDMLQTANVAKLVSEKASTPAAANHRLRIIRALMKHAIFLKWRSDDPTLGVSRLKEAAEGAQTWSEDDIAMYERRWAPGTKPRLALALLLYTGQRRSDIVRMGHQHVKDGSIEVRQQKTGARLFIPLHPELASLLANETDRLTFLVTEGGAPYTASGFYMRFRKWSSEAGLPPGRSPHGLRKAMARRLAEAGCTAHQIASITGHKTLSQVQIYTQAADQIRLAKAAMDRINHSQTMNNGVKPKVSNQD